MSDSTESKTLGTLGKDGLGLWDLREGGLRGSLWLSLPSLWLMLSFSRGWRMFGEWYQVFCHQLSITKKIWNQVFVRVYEAETQPLGPTAAILPVLGWASADHSCPRSGTIKGSILWSGSRTCLEKWWWMQVRNITFSGARNFSGTSPPSLVHQREEGRVSDKSCGSLSPDRSPFSEFLVS